MLRDDDARDYDDIYFEDEATSSTQAPKTSLQIGDSDWEFVDGDTAKNRITGKRVRVGNVDTRETAKFLSEQRYKQGEEGGDTATSFIWSLANRNGFNKVIESDETDTHGRGVGDVYDKDGVALSDMLLASGMVLPGFMGKSKITTDPYGSDIHLGGVARRDLRDPSFQDLSDWEKAAKLLRSSETEATNGIPLEKVMAFNAAEYAANPDLYKGIRTRVAGADSEGYTHTPFSTGWTVGWMGVGQAFDEVGQKLANMAGFEDLETYFASEIGTNERELAEMPLMRTDVTTVDWSSFDEATDSIASFFGSSLPYMGMTIAGMSAAPAVMMAGVGATAAVATGSVVPAMMYTGLVLDEMEGAVEDKNLAVAIPAGILMTVADRLGLKGIFKPSQFLTGEGKRELLAAAQRKGFTEAQVLAMSRRAMADLTADGAKFAQTQMAKGAMLKRAGFQLSKGTLSEGSTEMLQELTQYTAAVIGSDKNWDFDELEHRMINAAAAGGMMGGMMAIPGTAYEAGDWRGVSNALSEDDGRFTTAYDYVEDVEKSKYGRVRTNEEYTAQQQEEMNTYNSLPPMARDEAKIPEQRTAEEIASGYIPDEGFNAQRVWQFIKNSGVFFQAASSRTLGELAKELPTAARLLSISGYTRHGILPGQSFTNFQGQVQQKHQEIFGDHVELSGMFDTNRTSSDSKRQTEASNIIDGFYDDVLKGITGQGKGAKGKIPMRARTALSKVDWDNVPDVYKRNRKALEETILRADKLATTLRSETNAINAKADKEAVRELPDWIFRHKAFKREYIESNRNRFVELLMSSYKMKKSNADQVADAIISNEAIADLQSAFDVLEGGLTPGEHKGRTLHMSDKPEFNEFLEQNFFHNMNEASRANARYQSHMTFFGKDGELVNKAFNDMIIEAEAAAGSDKVKLAKLMAQIHKAAFNMNNLLNAESGNYNRIQSPFLKNAQKFITFLTAIQGLGLAAFSSLPEMGMLPHGVSREVLLKNIGQAGWMAGKAMSSYMKNLGDITRATGAAEKYGLKSHGELTPEVLARMAGADPRMMYKHDPSSLTKAAGLSLQETGAATTTGMTETSESYKAMSEAFFKANFLQDQTQMHRNIRASFFNDFFVEKLDMIINAPVGKQTVEVAEARKMLKDLGIPIDSMITLSGKMTNKREFPQLNHKDQARWLDLSKKVRDGKSLSGSEKSSYQRINSFLGSVGGFDGLTPNEKALWESQFLNAATNFINQAVPMPNAFNRPLFYSDPRFMLLTQFNGYTSTFTANQLPKLWDSLQGSTGMKYSTFATLSTMLFMAFISQAMKDEIKYGEESPYLTDREKVLRAIYSSGLLGTGERIMGSNWVMPLYGSDRYSTLGSFMWNNVASEAAAAGTVERGFNMAAGYFEDDNHKIMKNFYGSLPFLGPVKHRLMDWNNM